MRCYAPLLHVDTDDEGNAGARVDTAPLEGGAPEGGGDGGPLPPQPHLLLRHPRPAGVELQKEALGASRMGVRNNFSEFLLFDARLCKIDPKYECHR